MKTNLTQIAKAYLGSAAFFTIAGEGGMVLVDRYSVLYRSDYLLPVIVGFALPALPFGFYLAGRVASLTRQPERSQAGPAVAYYRSIAHTVNGKPGNLFTNSVAWVVGQKSAPGHTWGLSGEIGRTMKYKEPKPEPEFIFWEKGMESLITEVRLFNFCRIVWRRQQQASYGSLPSNQIFSRAYFTQQARPRYSLPDYRSVMYILVSRQLIINRWQGRAGQLLYPPGITVEEARLRWS